MLFNGAPSQGVRPSSAASTENNPQEHPTVSRGVWCLAAIFPFFVQEGPGTVNEDDQGAEQEQTDCGDLAAQFKGLVAVSKYDLMGTLGQIQGDHRLTNQPDLSGFAVHIGGPVGAVLRDGGV